MAEQQFQQQQIVAQPTAMTFQVGQAETGDGRTWVFLQVHHPAGTFVAFLDPAGAANLGKELARLGGAGQILVPAPIIPPGP